MDSIFPYSSHLGCLYVQPLFGFHIKFQFNHFFNQLHAVIQDVYKRQTDAGMSSTVGRYAPSPSGRMHLGNLCCCLLAWLSAKSNRGKVVLRNEALDAVRCPRQFADLLEADLAWLGLAADEGGSKGGPRGPYYQSERGAIYRCV